MKSFAFLFFGKFAYLKLVDEMRIIFTTYIIIYTYGCYNF